VKREIYDRISSKNGRYKLFAYFIDVSLGGKHAHNVRALAQWWASMLVLPTPAAGFSCLSMYESTKILA